MDTTQGRDTAASADVLPVGPAARPGTSITDPALATRAHPAVAAIAFTLSTVAVVAGLGGPVFIVAAGGRDLGLTTVQGVLALVYAVAGTRIATRQPGNAVGWVLVAVGVCQGLSGGTWPYADLGMDRGWPLAFEAGWLSNWIWAPSLAVLATLLPLLFPDGRPLSRRWWWVVALAVGATSTATAAIALPSWSSRFQLSEDLDLPQVYATIFEVAASVVAVLAVLSITSLVLRFRRSRGLERAQLRWFAIGGATTALGTMLAFLPSPSGLVVEVLWSTVLLGTLVAAPISVGVAVLRYRLYDLDRLVSRTVAYLAVLAVLAGVYAGAVLLFGRLLAPVTGGSQLAVAGSTLLVAALFQPLRRRVKTWVDRHFNRAGYDARLTVEAFSGRLREDLGLGSLRTHLLDAVASTVAPTTVSVWTRPLDGEDA